MTDNEQIGLRDGRPNRRGDQTIRLDDRAGRRESQRAARYGLWAGRRQRRRQDDADQARAWSAEGTDRPGARVRARSGGRSGGRALEDRLPVRREGPARLDAGRRAAPLQPGLLFELGRSVRGRAAADVRAGSGQEDQTAFQGTACRGPGCWLPWPIGPRSWCWTSLPPGWTRSCVATSWRPSFAPSRRKAAPCCFLPICWTKWSEFPTTLRSSTRGGSSSATSWTRSRTRFTVLRSASTHRNPTRPQSPEHSPGRGPGTSGLPCATADSTRFRRQPPKPAHGSSSRGYPSLDEIFVAQVGKKCPVSEGE